MTPLQQKEFQILLEFQKVCKKLSLEYYLVCGSALGAEKYQGFIPWDDDIDVALPRKDYDIFIKEAGKYLPHNIFLQNSTTDSNFPIMYTKLRDSETTFVEKTVAHINMNHGAFIDVFPLDGYPEGKLKSFVYELEKRYYNAVFLSVANIERTARTKVIHGIIGLFGLNKNVSRISEKYNKLVSKYSTDSSDIWCNHGNRSGKLEYAPKSQYGKGKKAIFEGVEVIVPEKTEEYLEQKYGDWRKDIPEEKKKSHHESVISDPFTPYSEYLILKSSDKLRFVLKKDMKLKVVFVSNFFNHHQKPLCDALYKDKRVEFLFSSTEEMEDERKKMGYDSVKVPSYVVNCGTKKEELLKLEKKIYEADIVICGFEPRHLFKRRLRENKITFYYTERPLKPNVKWWYYPKMYLTWKLRAPKNKAVYLLCASAYASWDYKKMNSFVNKAFKWGYFPEVNASFDPSEKKVENRILWCGRLLEWKHPMDVLEACLRLKKEGFDFKLKLIGNGEEESKLKSFVEKNDLGDRVEFSDFIPPNKVREEMEKSSVYLFTGDAQEGWGAVLNESMSSACAVVASHSAGATPYLVKDGENGLVYEAKNVEMLSEKLKLLLTSPERAEKLGLNAYETIKNTWNAETAASRFIELVVGIFEGSDVSKLFDDGPCSIATAIEDKWDKSPEK
jgi:phosphorylcholine metabolism protein LicD